MALESLPNTVAVSSGTTNSGFLSCPNTDYAKIIQNTRFTCLDLSLYASIFERKTTFVCFLRRNQFKVTSQFSFSFDLNCSRTLHSSVKPTSWFWGTDCCKKITGVKFDDEHSQRCMQIALIMTYFKHSFSVIFIRVISHLGGFGWTSIHFVALSTDLKCHWHYCSCLKLDSKCPPCQQHSSITRG